MKIHKSYMLSAFVLGLTTLSIFALVSCGALNTVASFIVSDRQYNEQKDLERARQPEQLTAGKDVYASVFFIESPKGMEYTAKWSIGGNVIKTDTQKLSTDRKGIIVYSLEGDKVTVGTLRLEISYEDSVLASRELAIVEE